MLPPVPPTQLRKPSTGQVRNAGVLLPNAIPTGGLRVRLGLATHPDVTTRRWGQTQVQRRSF